MLSAKRRDGEDFEDYKARRRREAKAMKRRLKGRWFWISAIIEPDHIRPGRYRKIKVRGTYVKNRD